MSIKEAESGRGRSADSWSSGMGAEREGVGESGIVVDRFEWGKS